MYHCAWPTWLPEVTSVTWPRRGFPWKGGVLACATESCAISDQTSTEGIPLEGWDARMRDRKCPWVLSIPSASYNLIIFYELTLSQLSITHKAGEIVIYLYNGNIKKLAKYYYNVHVFLLIFFLQCNLILHHEKGNNSSENSKTNKKKLVTVWFGLWCLTPLSTKKGAKSNCCIYHLQI